jgi:hypothetical protein
MNAYRNHGLRLYRTGDPGERCQRQGVLDQLRSGRRHCQYSAGGPPTPGGNNVGFELEIWKVANEYEEFKKKKRGNDNPEEYGFLAFGVTMTVVLVL